MPWIAVDRVKTLKQFRGDLQHRSLEIFTKMLEGRCSRNQQGVGRALEEPGQRNLRGRGLKKCCGCVECRRLEQSEASEREKRNVGYAV